ncbi:GNAT family N-acetyltransferase [Furfurilactobacillus milii]|uniref:GNAT family N-acetyltransferase n=1 Tax=Furfurilactobacillus milii TaxID=2888272 RepID=A0A6N9I3C5_9LACO|nr:GNAT family N-acetyltransferase [Furfurilactobacillus milii]MYV17632.1 GNAT family N-acetyltransferase [Furfurilactobacillus milii]
MNEESICNLSIVTTRGIIRPFSAREVDAFLSYHNNLDWMQYQGFKGLSKAEAVDALLSNPTLTQGKQFAFVQPETDQLLGDFYLQREGHTMWLGYTINPLFARHGYAFEGAKALIEFLSQQHVRVIKADVDPNNQASRRLLKKLSFKRIMQNDETVIFERRLTDFNN